MFFGCGTDENIFRPESTTTPGAYTSIEEVMAVVKAHGSAIASEALPSDILMGPVISVDKEKSKNFSKSGGKMRLRVGRVDNARIIFEVPKKALNQTTLITMRLFLEVVKNDDGTPGETRTLYFEFGPSGTQFDPCALLKIPFDILLAYDVDTCVATVESEGVIEGVSYDVDEVNEYLIAYIPHFSIYYYRRR